VLFNTNCTLLKIRKSRELIEAGLDELRVSLGPAKPAHYAKIAWAATCSTAILRNSRSWRRSRDRASRIRAYRWAQPAQETIEQLPDLLRIAIEVRKRCTCSASSIPEARGWRSLILLSRASSRRSAPIFTAPSAVPRARIFSTPPARRTEESLTRDVNGKPCHGRRPWSRMYFTAHAAPFPCIAPFSMQAIQLHARTPQDADAAADSGTAPPIEFPGRAAMSETPPAPAPIRCAGPLERGSDGIADAVIFLVEHIWTGNRSHFSGFVAPARRGMTECLSDSPPSFPLAARENKDAGGADHPDLERGEGDRARGSRASARAVDEDSCRRRQHRSHHRARPRCGAKVVDAGAAMGGPAGKARSPPAMDAASWSSWTATAPTSRAYRAPRSPIAGGMRFRIGSRGGEREAGSIRCTKSRRFGSLAMA